MKLVIRELSAAKDETRMDAGFPPQTYEAFRKMPMQSWGQILLRKLPLDDLIVTKRF